MSGETGAPPAAASEADTARRVAGIRNATPSWLRVVDEVDDETLERDYVGGVVPIWQYGVGDRIELARIKQ